MQLVYQCNESNGINDSNIDEDGNKITIGHLFNGNMRAMNEQTSANM